MTKKEIQEQFEKACEIAAKRTRSGSADHIICHPEVARAIQDALNMRDRALKINKLLNRIQR